MIFEYRNYIRILLLYLNIEISLSYLNMVVTFKYRNRMIFDIIIIFEYQIASDFQLCGKFYHEFVYISFEKKLFYIYNFL